MNNTLSPSLAFVPRTGLVVETLPDSRGRRFVTSDQRYLTDEELKAELGLELAPEFVVDLPPECGGRWTTPSRERFLNEAQVEPPRAVFDALVAHLRRYLELEDQRAYTVVALYIMGTYCYVAFHAYPYIVATGPAQSGKSTLLELMAALGFNALLTSSISSPALLRVLARSRGVLLVDENINGDGTLRNILKSGYRDAARVYRACGQSHSFRSYSAYGPRILASNADLQDSILATRALELHLEPSQRPLERMRSSDTESESGVLRDRLYSFALLHTPHIVDIYKHALQIPELDHRLQEVADPLLAIAELIDQDSGPAVSLDLQVFLIDQSTRRREDLDDHDGAKSLAAGVLAAPRKLQAVSWIDGHDYYVAEEVADFLYKFAFIDRPLVPEHLSRRLRASGLVEKKTRVEVPKLTPRRGKPLPGRTTRIGYRFNVTRAQQLAGEAP